ncbi:OLC1v1031234C1 [Oldenlandia corymbosa var. corymbosa]|uniref:RBR-type E3 ubiquitin transferase n=1 Tax=Oldenlandia corymbosa var. corymbosa TaxID=529605 RepID=A0AAV1CJN1_OLDCO|nr:OLC1v1031234C1 [Oldenlandia corymbosa var. corymbosa]
MSSRRGGYRRGGKQSQFHHPRQHDRNDELWTVKPIHDDAGIATSSSDQNANHPTTTAQSAGVAEFVPRNRKFQQNRRNSRRDKQNRRPEVGSVSSSERSYEEEKSIEQPSISNSCDSRLNGSGKCSGDVELKRDDDKFENVDVNENDEERKPQGSVSGDEEEVDEVQRRLQEFSLIFQEPELLEEQLKVNDQAQEDELLAMEAIYGDTMFILDRQNGLRCFQIHIHVDTPKEVSVSVNLSSSTVLEREVDTPEFSYSFKVDYLPPIILTCVLPHSYPSHSPPYFTISVLWLNSAKISTLCGILDSIWNEQSGQEVIYQWVEWLRSSCLPLLGFDREIILGPCGGLHEGDKRAISRSVSAEVDIPLIKSYNDEQRSENFSKDLHECCICFSEFPGTEFARLPCQHFFCWTCMKTYAEMHVKEGTVNKLLCPTAKCWGMIPPGLLRRLLGDDEYERWESMLLQKTLESMSDVTYCPRCETICIEDEDEHAQCSKCFFSFCTLCRERRHVGVVCMTPEMRLQVLMERQNSSQLKPEHKRREKEMINDMLSMREINTFAKQCPSCNMAISRTEGCNKMACGNCGSYFCYLCKKQIDGYEHFRNGSCNLFPAEEIQRWEEVNARQVIGQIQAQLYAGNGHPCPNCRQFNVKAGDLKIKNNTRSVYIRDEEEEEEEEEESSPPRVSSQKKKKMVEVRKSDRVSKPAKKYTPGDGAIRKKRSSKDIMAKYMMMIRENEIIGYSDRGGCRAEGKHPHDHSEFGPSSSQQSFNHPSKTARGKGFAEFNPSNRKFRHNRRNSRSDTWNRRSQVVKDQPVEMGSLSTDERNYEAGSDVGCQNITQSRFNERGNFSGDEELKRDGDNGEFVEVKEDDEEEERKSQGRGSSNEQVDDLEERLQELLLSLEELELPEEQLSINDQAQEDELLAMESIYGDNMFILDKHNGLKSFQEVSVCVNLGSSTALEAEDDLPEFSYSFEVQYLPPIEVIYHWVEWLHSSCFPFLGFDNEITLGPYDVSYEGDKRAISGSISAEVDVPLIKSYDDEQQYKNFSKNLHECCICFSELPGMEFARLPCQHFFCRTCMKTYSEMHVKEGTVNNLLCPSAKCGGMIPPCLLGQLLGDDTYERWESMMLQKTLESMSDVMYCPRCETFCIKDEDEHAQCSKCFFSFCTLCGEPRHVGAPCMDPEVELQILKERQGSSRHELQLKQITPEQKKQQDKINAKLSERLIKVTAKKCPSCKIYISRTEGCNHMFCRNCGDEFFYNCGKRIDGYEHFRKGHCNLIPDVGKVTRSYVLPGWEARMNARRVLDMQVQNLSVDGHPCPTCRQLNAKLLALYSLASCEEDGDHMEDNHAEDNGDYTSISDQSNEDQSISEGSRESDEEVENKFATKDMHIYRSQGTCFKNKEDAKNGITAWNIEQKREFYVKESNGSTWYIWCKSLKESTPKGYVPCRWKEEYVKSWKCITPVPTDLWEDFKKKEKKAVQHKVNRYGAINGKFKVKSRARLGGKGDNTYTVKYEEKNCSCKKWQEYRFPCKHALAVGRK